MDTRPSDLGRSARLNPRSWPTDIAATGSAARHAFKRLTEAEARRALYIDFEGTTGKPPVLLGVLRRGGNGEEPFVPQWVVDPAFAQTGTELRSLRNAIEVVVMRAEHGDRRIVAWTEHELKVVRTLYDEAPDLVVRFESRFANARGVAERWLSKLGRQDKPKVGRLVDYMELIDYRVPPEGGPGQVGNSIRAIRPTLEAGRRMTELQKARWGRLLTHNRHDCAGMRAVCIQAALEIERADAEVQSPSALRRRRKKRRKARAALRKASIAERGAAI